MLEAVYSSLMTHSSARITYSGGIKIVITIVGEGAACFGMDQDVRAQCRGVRIHGTTLIIAALPACHSRVQTSQIR